MCIPQPIRILFVFILIFGLIGPFPSVLLADHGDTSLTQPTILVTVNNGTPFAPNHSVDAETGDKVYVHADIARSNSADGFLLFTTDNWQSTQRKDLEELPETMEAPLSPMQPFGAEILLEQPGNFQLIALITDAEGVTLLPGNKKAYLIEITGNPVDADGKPDGTDFIDKIKNSNGDPNIAVLQKMINDIEDEGLFEALNDMESPTSISAYKTTGTTEEIIERIINNERSDLIGDEGDEDSVTLSFEASEKTGDRAVKAISTYISGLDDFMDFGPDEDIDTTFAMLGKAITAAFTPTTDFDSVELLDGEGSAFHLWADLHYTVLVVRAKSGDVYVVQLGEMSEA